MKMKYIMFSDGVIDFPYMFSDVEQHTSVAARLGGLERPIVGAGFVHIDFRTRKYICYGTSIGLNIDSRKDIDSAIFNKYAGIK